MDCNLLGSSVHGILQARILEWASISSSRGSSWPRNQAQISCTAGRFFTHWATREAMPSKLCPNLEGVVRSSIVMFQRGHDQLVDIILTGWWWGKWKSGSLTILLVRGLPSCGQHTVNFSRLEGVSVSTKQLKEIVIVFLGALPQGCSILSFDCSHLFSTSPPFPS